MSDDSRPPTGKLARAQIVGSAALGAGMTRLRYAVSGLGSRERDRDERRDEEIARQVFAAIGQLRGTALKISQILATEEDLVPEPLRRELARAAYRAPPLNRAVARQIVQAELGKAPERIFARFESQPFAAASLGQVHRATAHDGRELALKLQYPGIDLAIAADVQMVRTLLKAFRPLADKRDSSPRPGNRAAFEALEPMLDEIELRLHEEVDYLREAQASEWFRVHLEHPKIVVPAVVGEWSTKHVLTTELLVGQHLTEWLASKPSKTTIDELGQALCELFFHSIFTLRRVHSDPNPGNYLFLADGRIGLLDFGCTDVVSPEVTAFFGLCMRGYMSGDLDAVLDEYQRLGLVSAQLSAQSRARYHELMLPSRVWVAETVGVPSIDFAAHQGIIAKIREAAFTLGPQFERSVPGLLFLSRAFTGLFRTLQAMGAEVEMNKLIPSREAFLAMRTSGGAR